MDFVALLRFRDNSTQAERDAALIRRAGWNYPDGIRPIVEYWPAASDVTVVSIFSADEYEPVWQFGLEWNDVFHIDISPATSAEDGLRIGPDVMGRLTRMKS